MRWLRFEHEFKSGFGCVDGELAILIGRHASGIAREDAAARIFGECAANDVTARAALRPPDPGSPPARHG